MNFKEHAVISRKTWHKEDVSKERRLNHAKLGLIDELGEIASCLKKNVGYGKDIDLVNLKEEIGDFVYFLQRHIEESQIEELSEWLDFDYILNTHIYSLESQTNTNLLISVNYFLSMYLEDDRDNNELNLLIRSLINFAHSNNLNFNDILQTNINKLKARFGDDLEFSTDKATNRDLVKERKVLEG